MVKSRTNIPTDVASEVMFSSNNTCCVCQERGKPVQIHHIDEKPDNNDLHNLALLCLECHNETQVKGGFGRKLNGSTIIRYRNDWIKRVVKRRTAADNMAVNRRVVGLDEEFALRVQTDEEHIPDPPLLYVNALPLFKAELLKHAQPEWDSGITSMMVQASYDYIDALQGILVTLARYCSNKQFAGKSPQEFISNMIASRFEWHRVHAEHRGPGTGGTIVNLICSGNVMSDVERMVEDMVMSLTVDNNAFDQINWSRQWRNE